MTKWPPAKAGLVQAGSATMPAVDPRQLARIVGSSPAVIGKFLSIYLASACKGVNEIHAAFGNRSAAAIAAQAHKMKSAARTVGADPLADLCEQLERAGKEADWATLDAASARLDPAFAAVESFIQAHAASGA